MSNVKDKHKATPSHHSCPARTFGQIAVKQDKRLLDYLFALSVQDTDDRIFKKITFAVEEISSARDAWIVRETLHFKHTSSVEGVEHKERDRMFLVDKDLAYKLVGVLNEHWAPEAARYQSSSRATKGEKAITE